MTANPERGEVELIVGERTFVLKPTINNLCAMERRLNRSYGLIVQALVDNDLTAARELLFTFLQPHHGPQFRTIEAVGPLMDDLGDPAYVREVVAKVVMANRSRRQADPLKAQIATGTGEGWPSTPDVSA